MEAAGGSRSSPQEEGKAAHVLIFPFPIQGHVNTMLRLAKLLSLAAPALHVTFLNSDYNHRRFFSRARPPLLPRRPGFRFRSIPDGLPDDRSRSAVRLLDLEESLRTRAAAPFRDLLISSRSGAEAGEGWPPVTCAIVDGIMPFAVDVAEGLGIPAIYFRTISACSFWAYLSIPHLIQNQELPFPDDADLDEPVRGVPGMERVLRRRDLPSLCRQARETTDRALEFVSTATASTTRARGLILNTFESLESPVLSRIRSHFPVTYTPGPLHALLRTFTSRAADELTAMSADLWDQDRTCMTWLDAQPDGSVVYVSFGSLATVTPAELLEFWHGLVNSGQRFLWVVRPDMVSEGGGAPPTPAVAELEEWTRERGCVVEWAPQEEVLAHRAVGCFLTHGGWNSVVESVAAGVPMVCWPFFADQQTNSRFASEVWGLGADMKDRCERRVVEKMVREVVGGEEVRRAARDMAEAVRRSVGEGGSSYVELGRLVKDIESLSSLVDGQ